MSVSPTLTRGVLEEQLPAVEAWAARHAWAAHLPTDGFQLRFGAYHPLGTLLEVTAEVVGFPGEPPAWRFVNPGTDEEAVKFPAAGQLPGTGGSIFHGNHVICAPWNRCAYQSHDPKGPHNDWSITGWQEVSGYTRALTIADMLDQIRIHLRQSPGFM